MGADNGKYEAVEYINNSDGQNMTQVVTNFSLNKKMLLTYEKDEQDLNVFNLATHEPIDLKCQYTWILLTLDITHKLTPAEIKELVELLV